MPGPIALKLFDSLGCMAFPLYCTIDGAFPNHEPNPSEVKNLAALQAKVLEQGADLGFAFDGDGDRVVVISAQGRIVWPDQLMIIFARDVLARNPGSDIVFDVKSSKRLAELIRQHRAGVRPYTSSYDFAEPCVFSKQSPPPGLCPQLPVA